jgi:hypothetical protein
MHMAITSMIALHHTRMTTIHPWIGRMATINCRSRARCKLVVVVLFNLLLEQTQLNWLLAIMCRNYYCVLLILFFEIITAT